MLGVNRSYNNEYSREKQEAFFPQLTCSLENNDPRHITLSGEKGCLKC